MQRNHRIDAIEGRAKGLNLSLRRLCEVAEVEYTSVWRWRRGDVEPTSERLESVLAALEDALSDLETSMVKRIRARPEGRPRAS